MTTEAKQQTDLSIKNTVQPVQLEMAEAGFVVHTAEESKETDEDEAICCCGERMEKEERPESFLSNDYCSQCQFGFNKGQTHEYYYKCSNDDQDSHKKDYYLCLSCSEYRQKFSDSTIKDIYSKNNLYFIYNDNKITGPYNKDDLIILFVAKKLKETKMYIMPANKKNEWTKFEFPKQILSNLKPRDEKRCNWLKECENVNEEFKEKYPELYSNLVENALSGKLEQVEVPSDIPEDEKKSSVLKRFIKLLGKIFGIFMVIVLIIHELPTLILTTILVIILVVYARRAWQSGTNPDEGYTAPILLASIHFTTSCGFILVPIIISHIILTRSDMYNEIQSWMVAYIVWGIFSCLAIFIPLLAGLKQMLSIRKTIQNLIFIIVGIDFGDFDVYSNIFSASRDGTDIFTQLSLQWIFPLLASSLPAAIAGFIANFILEEKFELKCDNDIEDDTLCFKGERGCCDIISSHDYRNSYSFIGGLASNILATWAVIRICGYLLVNAYPQLSLYAKRK